MACWEDEMFKNPGVADDFSCPICYGVFKDPVRDPHGHVFGETCIANSIVNNGNCPMTRTSIRGQLVPAQDIRDQMATEEVYCCVRGDGCEWEGVLGGIDHHLQNQCQFFPLPCRFTPCKEFLPRTQMSVHEANCPHRPVPCGYCGRSLHANALESHIQKDCPDYSIPCSSQCEQTFPRKLLTFHLKFACPLRQVKCRFSALGCQFKGRPEEISCHMQLAAFLHLTLAEEQVAQHQAMVAAINSQTALLQTLANQVPSTEGSKTKENLLATVETLRTLQSKKYETNPIGFYAPKEFLAGRVTIGQRDVSATGALGDVLLVDRDFNRNSQLVFTASRKQGEGDEAMTVVGFVPKMEVALLPTNQLANPADKKFLSMVVGRQRLEGLPFLSADSGDPVMLEYCTDDRRVLLTNLASGEEVEVPADIDPIIWQPFLALWGTQTVRLEAMNERNQSHP